MPVDESLASLPFYNLTTAELIGDLLYTSITVKESYCQNPSFCNDIYVQQVIIAYYKNFN